MRQGTYLNVILTVNASLLAALVWTQIAEQPVLVNDVVAGPTPASVLDAGAQRQRMIDSVGRLEHSMDQSMTELVRAVNTTRAVLKSGQIQVQVLNTGDLVRERPVKSLPEPPRLSEMMRRQ